MKTLILLKLLMEMLSLVKVIDKETPKMTSLVQACMPKIKKGWENLDQGSPLQGKLSKREMMPAQGQEPTKT